MRYPGFDPAILAQAEAEKNTLTLAELITTVGAVTPAQKYSNPVAVVNGENDFPFCSGNCSYLADKAAAVRLTWLPNTLAANLNSYLAPDVGHGLNLHYAAAGTYKFIHHFLRSHGLGM